MREFKGIVTKISGNKCIIMTSDGDFQRVPLPPGPVRVGQEISGKMSSRFSGLSGLSRYATLAACLLLVLVGLFAIQLPALADPAAYVSLDINPSLELAVDSHLKVIGYKALNKDASRLMTDIEYKDRDVYQVLSEVLQKAVELRYVSESKNNLVVSSVVELTPTLHLDTAKLQRAVAQPLKASKIRVSVLFFKANKAEHDKAENLQLSTGKYVLLQEDENSDSQMALNDYRNRSLSSLADEDRLKISVKRQKMVIYDTTVWEEEVAVPATSTASGNYHWTTEESKDADTHTSTITNAATDSETDSDRPAKNTSVNGRLQSENGHSRATSGTGSIRNKTDDTDQPVKQTQTKSQGQTPTVKKDSQKTVPVPDLKKQEQTKDQEAKPGSNEKSDKNRDSQSKDKTIQHKSDEE